MGIIEDFFGRSDSAGSPQKRNPESLQKMIKMIETRKADAQLRLSREREGRDPDQRKMDRLEREIQMWETQKQRLEQKLKEI